MATSPEVGSSPSALDPSLSLFQLLDPAVHADPYPFYKHLREQSPVHWDGFMHTWVVTRYEDVMTVLHSFSADRTPDPQEMAALGLPSLILHLLFAVAAISLALALKSFSRGRA